MIGISKKQLYNLETIGDIIFLPRIPKENEIIIYTDFNSIKIGNGKTKVNDLPFVDNNEYMVEEDTLVINTKEVK